MLRWLLLMLVVLLVFAFGAALCSFPTGKVCHPSVFVVKIIDSRDAEGLGPMGEPWVARAPPSLLLALCKGPCAMQWGGETPWDGCMWALVAWLFAC